MLKLYCTHLIRHLGSCILRIRFPGCFFNVFPSGGNPIEVMGEAQSCIFNFSWDRDDYSASHSKHKGLHWLSDG